MKKGIRKIEEYTDHEHRRVTVFRSIDNKDVAFQGSLMLFDMAWDFTIEAKRLKEAFANYDEIEKKAAEGITNEVEKARAERSSKLAAAPNAPMVVPASGHDLKMADMAASIRGG